MILILKSLNVDYKFIIYKQYKSLLKGNEKLLILFLAAYIIWKVLLILFLPSWSDIGSDCPVANQSMAQQFEESKAKGF